MSNSDNLGSTAPTKKQRRSMAQGIQEMGLPHIL
jgi:hypothetical protein